ncbi:MAG: TIGR03905 family TSCPD domain-containing protein [Kiritimatiellae bacterium]|nr:TIGR03905 family TSCPD domain-containing protein [Kiritimatiellia bacterium]
MKTYKTQGTCSQAIRYEVENGVLTACSFLGGCPGNTQGVARLAVGRPADEVIRLLKGVQCRGGTSCPDQLARALEADKAASAGIVTP